MFFLFAQKLVNTLGLVKKKSKDFFLKVAKGFRFRDLKSVLEITRLHPIKLSPELKKKF